ncbi:MAG TPA: hypothetical protein VI112_14435 [Bacteroidia bacterium]|jgi:hypothetical protein
MPYTWSICDPFTPGLIEKGEIDKEEIMDTFMKHPWMELCRKMNALPDIEPFFSPTLTFCEVETQADICFSFTGDDGLYNFMVVINFEDTYGDRDGFNLEASKELLEAFLRGDFKFIEQKIC